MPSTSAADLFREGRLRDAIEVQSTAVRGAPLDIGKRWFLAELLCFAGDWERADRTLDVIALQATQQQGAVRAFQNLLRGEEMRRQVMTEGRAPQILGSGGDVLRPAVAALLYLRQGRPEEAVRNLREGERSAVPVAGTRNGEEAFDTFRDLDDVCSSFIELIADGGQYHWISVADIAIIELRRLTTARDLIWRPAYLAVRDGPEGDVFLPAVYINDVPDGDDALRLGRRTEWLEREESPVRGTGLRTFLVGETDIPIHELGRVEFTAGERKMSAP